MLPALGIIAGVVLRRLSVAVCVALCGVFTLYRHIPPHIYLAWLYEACGGFLAVYSDTEILSQAPESLADGAIMLFHVEVDDTPMHTTSKAMERIRVFGIRIDAYAVAVLVVSVVAYRANISASLACRSQILGISALYLVFCIVSIHS